MDCAARKANRSFEIRDLIFLGPLQLDLLRQVNLHAVRVRLALFL